MGANPSASFYSILVRLKATIMGNPTQNDVERFYSILVRLKARIPIYHENTPYQFLFHTGSIKSNENSQGTRDPRFLFHTGSIKSDLIILENLRLSHVSIPYWFD